MKTISRLTSQKKNYTSESAVAATAAVVAGYTAATVGALVLLAAPDRKRLKQLMSDYEHAYPNIPKFSSLKKTTTKEEIKGDSKANLQLIDQFQDTKGTPLFTIHYRSMFVPKNVQMDSYMKCMAYTPKNDIAKEHKNYYLSGWALSISDLSWFGMVSFRSLQQQLRAKIASAKETTNVETKKDEKPVKESYQPGLFSDDNVIKAGLIAGTAGQIGNMAMSREEKKYRSELGQIQAVLNGNPLNMSEDQKILMASRAGIILNELAKLERRKGTAKAIRNASLMIAASSQIHKMYVNGKNNGPDNPEMISLIGGIPELL